ncbi:Uncharacterised protein [Bordetella pertussis]|nr:Uncharacterised protein [Bordetella pertussis]
MQQRPRPPRRRARLNGGRRKTPRAGGSGPILHNAGSPATSLTPSCNDCYWTATAG